MSSLDKLGPNNGSSLNFDGASLQNQQEDEYRREEELQQNELRALLTNAFDDLSDEDDILSDITSDDGADSRNISLHSRRHSNDSINKLTDLNKIIEEPVQDKGWDGKNFLKGSEGLPQISGMRLSRTAEFSRGQLEALRASVESLPSYPARRAVRESGSEVTMRDHHTADDKKHGDQGVPSDVVTPVGNGSVRSSVEDFTAYSAPYEAHHQDHFYQGSQGNHPDPNIQYPAHQHYADQQYNQGLGHGHYYHDYHLHHNHQQGEPLHPPEHHPLDHHGYNTQHNQLHHFKKIYQDRPYHTIGEREETEGGNVITSDQYFHIQHPEYALHGNHHHHHLGYYGEGQEHVNHPQDQSQNSVPTMGPGHQAGVPSVQTEAPPVAREIVQGNERVGETGRKRRELPVVYKREEEADRENQKEKQIKDSTDRQFMEQEGSGEQLAQLQILYQARGRKIEELNQQLETQKSETGREIRILKHQLSVIKGEKEGASQSVGSLQGLLQEVQEENNKLHGRLSACQSRVDSLTHNKEELVQKLKTAETTIESLHEHLQEMGSSESLSRARHEHETVVSGLQRKHDTEIKHLQAERDQLTSQLKEQTDEIGRLKQQLQDGTRASESAQVSRAETINRLTQSLEESQRRCRNLLDSTSAQDMSQMKLQLQQALAARSISDEMCSSLQEEVNDVKEQLQMLEAASNLGLGTSQSDQNDSMADLGIKRTLDFDDTPVNTPVRGGRGGGLNSSGDVVSSLKAELERCLVNNKKKRAEVSEVREELTRAKGELTSTLKRCEHAELISQEQKHRITELETALGSADGTNAMEERLKKDIDKLRREKAVLLEDIQELQGRLEEVSSSEEKMSHLNRELSKQIADMVREYDDDKRQALDSLQRACEQVSETSRVNLRKELTQEHEEQQQILVAKYEQEVSTLRSELQKVQTEVNDVKELYVSVCGEKDVLKSRLDAEWQSKLDLQLSQLKETLKSEERETLGAVEKDKLSEIETLKSAVAAKAKEIEEKDREIISMEKEIEIKDTEIASKKKDNDMKDREIGSKEKDLEKVRVEVLELTNCLNEKGNELSRLKDELASKEVEICKHQSDIDSLKLDVSEQLNKSCEQLRDVETLEGEITEKDAFIAEQATVVEKLISDLDTAVNELDNFKLKAHMDISNVKAELDKRQEQEQTLRQDYEKQLVDHVEKISGLTEELERKCGEVIKFKGSVSQLERKCANAELGCSELEKKCTDLEQKCSEFESSCSELKKKCEDLEEKCAELESVSKSKDGARVPGEGEEDAVRREIEKNSLREKQTEIDKLKKELICLKYEIVRLENEKQSEVVKVSGMKQTEIDIILKKHQAEMERLKKEKQLEMERVTHEKDEEIQGLKKLRNENVSRSEEGEVSRIRDSLRREMGENMKKTLDTRVAMAKVAWLEEHRVTRQTAIDNAVRLAEAELRQRMEDDLEEKLRQRLEQGEKEEANLQGLLKELQEENKNLHDHLSTCQSSLDALTHNNEELVQKLKTAQTTIESRSHAHHEHEKVVSGLQRKHDMEIKHLHAERDQLKTQLKEQSNRIEKRWRNEIMPKMVDEEREKWVSSLGDRIQTKLNNSFEESVKTEVQSRVETERLKLEKESEARVIEAIQEHETACSLTLQETLTAEREALTQKMDAELQERFNAEKKVWKQMVDMETKEKLLIEKEKWRGDKDKELKKLKDRESKVRADYEALLGEKTEELGKAMDNRIEQERLKIREGLEGIFEERLEEEKKIIEQEGLKVKEEMEGMFEMRLEVEKKRIELENLKIREEMEGTFEIRLEEEKERIEQENLKIREEMEGMFEMRLEVEKKRIAEEAENKTGKEHEKITKDSERQFEKDREVIAKEFEVKLQDERDTMIKEFERKLDFEKERLANDRNKEYEEKLDEERKLIIMSLEAEFEGRLEEETKLVKEAFNAEFEERLKKEIENARERLEQAAKVDIEQMRVNLDDEAQLDYEELRARLETELRNEYGVLQEELEAECERTVERERELVEVRLGREVARAVQEEEVRWRARLEDTLKDRLAVEEERWNTMIETHLVSRLHAERDKWQSLKEQEITEEKKKWKEEWEMEKQGEMDQQREGIREKVEVEMKTEMEKFRSSLEEKFHKDLKQEVGVAVQEAREAWQREYIRKMALNTSTAHVSQGLLKEEIESLQSELLSKTEVWAKERQELVSQKDVERREAVDALRQESDAEYQQLVQQHNSTLESALKVAREQHTRDKGEMEERYQNQMKLLQERLQKEKLMMERQLSDLSCELSKWKSSDNTSSREVQRLQAQLNKMKNQDDLNKMTQKISELMGNLKESEAKVKELTNQIDELKESETKVETLTKQIEELKDCETKMEKFTNQIEEFRKCNSELVNEKEGFVKKNKELTDEINELQKQNKELIRLNEGNEKRMKELANELQSVTDKVQDYERVSGELQKAKDLLREFKDELTDTQVKCQRYRHDAQEVHAQLARAEQSQHKIQTELDRLRDERSHLLESVKSIEESYRADVTAYQQRLQEGNAKAAKTEKMLQDMKHKYRLALESYRAALEAENDEAMKAMKRKHESILDAMSRQHAIERESLAKQGHITLEKSGNSQTAVGDIDETVCELRSHYLDTVAKIKDDVLRHVTQTNMRAAETVKTEIDKERSSTFEQIKDFYRKHAKQILESDNVGGNMERCLDAGLHAAQEALLSSAQSSRSTTPLSEDLLDTPRSRSTTRHAYGHDSRSRSTSRDTYGRDAGISPKGQRTVSFTDSMNGRAKFSATSFDDVRSPKGRILAKSPRDANITVRGEGRHFDTSELRLSREWNGDADRDSSFDTRRPDNRPRSAKLVRELRDSELRESRLTSARSARDLHLSLRERHQDVSEMSRSQVLSSDIDANGNDKRKSRTLISTRDIHAARHSRPADADVVGRSWSNGPSFLTSSALTRPTSVPDLTTEDKEFSVWGDTSLNETAPQFLTLRESRTSSKSESNLSFLTESPRDAGETPSSTPRRHRKHFTLHAFPTVDQISSELLTNGTSGPSSDKSPITDKEHTDQMMLSPSKSFTPTRSDRKNLPLIQFRHGRVQSISKFGSVKSKSPHPDEPPVTSTPDKRSLSVQPSDLHMNF